MKKMQTALVLGGGGARGLAHLGVLEVLEANNILPTFIVGTSMGAIIGAAYALHPNVAELREKTNECLNDDTLQKIEKRFDNLTHPVQLDGLKGRISKLFQDMHRIYLWNKSAMDQSLIDSAVISELIQKLVNQHTFDDLRLPFYAVAFDLRQSVDVVLGKGNLASVLLASSAIPGVFEPVRREELILVDGCVDQEIPARTARQLGAEAMIVVDVSADCKTDVGSSAAEIMSRVSVLRVQSMRKQELTLADVVIRPDVGTMHWSQFSQAEAAFEAGRKAASEQLPFIRKALHRANLKTSLTRWFKRPGSKVEITGLS